MLTYVSWCNGHMYSFIYLNLSVLYNKSIIYNLYIYNRSIIVLAAGPTKELRSVYGGFMESSLKLYRRVHYYLYMYSVFVKYRFALEKNTKHSFTASVFSTLISKLLSGVELVKVIARLRLVSSETKQEHINLIICCKTY